MRSPRVLSAVAAMSVLAVLVWQVSGLLREPAGQVSAVDPEQAALERLIERTTRESQTGVEAPDSEAAPLPDAAQQADGSRQDAAPAVSTESGVDPDQLPAGYTLGTYRGAMERAPLTSAAEPELAPNPEWLDAGPAHDAILEQAARSERDFTFAVLRVLPGTNLQNLNRSLAPLGARIEGATGPYVRVRVPAEPEQLEAIAALDGVLGVGAVPPRIKADETFVQDMLARPASEPVPVYITLMTEDPAGEWRQALTALGVTVGAYDSDLRSYTANLTPAAFAEVVAADYVLSVEAIPVVTTNHASSVPVMGADGFRQYNPATETFTGITGAGIAVGILDTALNTSHVDIAHGRASICGSSFAVDNAWDLWTDLHGHGTHVFGTIIGAGRENPLLAGIAPGVSHLRMGKVVTHGGHGTDSDIRRGMDYLARPTNCSWRGTRSEAVKAHIVNMSLAFVSLGASGRGTGERKLDSVVQGHSQLYVVAQANAAQHGFSNYGTAKNSLAVGAVDDTGIIAWFSSHGPTADGRLAPNVVATGVRLTSARGRAAVSGYNTFSGTSMAAPSVAGVAALLMQARPEFQDRPALTRARLMASAIRPHAYLESRDQLPADNTDGPGAFNNLYGLGLVSARTTLFSRDEPGGWLIGSATSQPDGDSYEYIDIEVPEGAGRLDIVMTWDEQPADTLTRSVLNNLDLWADRGADCEADACGEHASRSEVDNVEWLLIEDPVPGTYRIKVVPVEIYGESSTAAVAWKILRDEPVPQLDVVLEDVSESAESDYITIEVTVDADRYVASGTTLHIDCNEKFGRCGQLLNAHEAYRGRVYREDGLDWAMPRVVGVLTPMPIPIGEVAAGTPKRVRLPFLRERFPSGKLVHVTTSSWNAMAAGRGIAIGTDAADNDMDADAHGNPVAPANDDFAASERIDGATGATPLELVLASREPGEPLVIADSRTVWYTWTAPASGLFRFRLHNVRRDRPMEADFALFTGDGLVDLELVTEKTGSEISFAAQPSVEYRLRIASAEENLPPLRLEWESADARPANDDFAYAQLIEGERGSIESSNEGATLENSEFLSGAASSVWYTWTAPADGWWRVLPAPGGLDAYVFVGESLEQLRLVSVRDPNGQTWFPATMGETYRIAVAARSADDSGARFTLWWSEYSGHPEVLAGNDLFENATEIDGAEGRVEPILLGERHRILYSVESGEPLETGISTGWWQWTAPSDGRFTWRMNGDRAFRLTVFTGDALQDLQLVGSLNGGSAFVLDATGGTRYWIAYGRSPELLHHRVPFFTGNAFTWGPTPPNDSRAEATVIVGAGGSAEVMLGFATFAPNDPADTVGTDSAWWRWRAPASGWQRFRVQGDPVSTILSVYPGDTSVHALANSERSFIANGRIEVLMPVQAGQEYDIRIASRPGVDKEALTTLRWESSIAPPALAYKREVRIDSLAANPLARGFHSPHKLAISDDGNYLFSSAFGAVFAFMRDPLTGELALALRGLAPPERTTSEAQALQRAFLWWNAAHERLFALSDNARHGFALPEDGSTSLPRSEIVVQGADLRIRSDTATVASSDGQFLYVANRHENRLDAFRVDSATLLARAQSVSFDGTAGDAELNVAAEGRPLDMTLSSDGEYLYVVTDRELLVFSRDSSSGARELVREIPHDGTSDSVFGDVRSLANVSLDGTGTMLFVSGRRSFGALRAGFTAFDISTDPSNPAHLDTLTQLHYETDAVSFRPLSHLLDRLYAFSEPWCNLLLPHAGHTGIDVFCSHGFAVIAWNPATSALEVADLAVADSEDRFGNRLPPVLGSRTANPGRIVPSPDGRHIYRATNFESEEFSDAIHIFERASAMTPGGDGEPTGGDTAMPMDPAVPDEPTDGDDGTTPDPVTEGDCYVGLLVGIGEICTYPGTTDKFSVNERGRASFLGRLAGIVIRIANETIDGRVYNFEARHQGEGVWRINRVGEST